MSATHCHVTSCQPTTWFIRGCHQCDLSACRGRNKPSRFEPPREDDEEALVAELAPLASDNLRCLPCLCQHGSLAVPGKATCTSQC